MRNRSHLRPRAGTSAVSFGQGKLGHIGIGLTLGNCHLLVGKEHINGVGEILGMGNFNQPLFCNIHLLNVCWTISKYLIRCRVLRMVRRYEHNKLIEKKRVDELINVEWTMYLFVIMI